MLVLEEKGPLVYDVKLIVDLFAGMDISAGNPMMELTLKEFPWRTKGHNGSLILFSRLVSKTDLQCILSEVMRLITCCCR